MGEEGVPFHTIAEAIGRGAGLPVVSVAAEDAFDHFGFLGAFNGADIPASSEATRTLLGWQPTHATLLEDLESGVYFA